jgi:hypothetical protein
MTAPDRSNPAGDPRAERGRVAICIEASQATAAHKATA